MIALYFAERTESVTENVQRLRYCYLLFPAHKPNSLNQMIFHFFSYLRQDQMPRLSQLNNDLTPVFV